MWVQGGVVRRGCVVSDLLAALNALLVTSGLWCIWFGWLAVARLWRSGRLD